VSNKAILKNFASYGIGSIVTLILGFLTNPIITRMIDPIEYGKYSMFTLFTSVSLLIVVFGLDQSFVRFFYERNEDLRGNLLLYCLKFAIIVNIVFSICLILFYKKVTLYLFQIESLELIILIIVSNFILLFNRYSLLVIRMQQKALLYSLMQILQKVAFLFLFLSLIFSFESNFKVLIYASIVTNIIVTLLSIYFEKRFWKTTFISFNPGLSSSTKNEMLKFGTPLIFTSLITWIFQSIDRIFINKYSGFEELGIYSAAFTIIVLLNALQTTFTTFWVPVAYEKYAINKNEKNFFEVVNRAITLSMFYISILLILFKDFIVYLLGSDYREAAFIMPFLIFMPLLYTISETTVLGINFMKKAKYHIYIAVVSCVVSVILNIVFVPTFGAKGAAFSTAISYFVFFTLRTIISKKLYNLNYSLSKFYICIAFISIYALYSSFNKIDVTIIFLAFFNISLVTIFYWKDINYALTKIKPYIHKNIIRK